MVSNVRQNAIQQLDTVIQQNASATEQMASTSEELSGQSEHLMEVLEFFRIEGDHKLKMARARMPARTAHQRTARQNEDRRARAGVASDMDNGRDKDSLDEQFEEF